MMIPTLLMVAILLIDHRSIAQNCQQTGCEPGYCCSYWGFCGNSELHCYGGHGNGKNFGICDPPCGPGYCCSRWGFCGDTPLHCSGGPFNSTGGGMCDPPCRPGFCCSRWGFCGNTPLHCGSGLWNHTGTVTCDPPCAAGFCCSRWGFCGDTPLHCEGGRGNGTVAATCYPPCAPGQCCSKWGFCGNSELHCANNGTIVPPTVTPPIQPNQCSPECPPDLCCSRWGFCTSAVENCDEPPKGGKNETTMTRERFDCIFDELTPDQRDQRWNGYQEALKVIPLNPQNQDELMMFFAHVSHETDGLKTYEEYCGQSGECADDYQGSWCPPVEAEPGKQYYGRGWFQLSWPCNYNGAGQALGIDFLKDPDLVAQSDTYAAATAIWFWKANNMGVPARDGNFGGSTRIINSIECGPTARQDSRIERYQKVRRCFGLNDATENLRC